MTLRCTDKEDVMADKKTKASEKFSQNAGAKQATYVRMGHEPGTKYGQDPHKKAK